MKQFSSFVKEKRKMFMTRKKGGYKEERSRVGGEIRGRGGGFKA